MANKYVGAAKFLGDLVFGKPKVSPTIKSVKPNLKKTIKQTKTEEFRKRYKALDKAEDKVVTGKKMMKEGQRERKKMVDTGRAFQFRSGTSYHAIAPGDKQKYGKQMKVAGPQKKFKKGKELDREKKMGGGMMGRRMGYSEGKLAVTPREKQLAAQYGDKKRITRGDVITAAKKKSGNKNV